MNTNIRLQPNGQWLVSFRGIDLDRRANFTQAIDFLLNWLRENVKEDVDLAIESIDGRVDYYHFAFASGDVRPQASMAA